MIIFKKLKEKIYKNLWFKKFIFVFILLITFAFLFSCAPISNEADAENFANAMIKGFMMDDSDVQKSTSKAFTSLTITYEELQTSQFPTAFSGSHFASDITTEFSGVSFTYNNTNLIYNDETYIVSGKVYWVADISMSLSGFSGTIIAYGNLQVTKNGQTQDVKFDSKYQATFTVTDENHDSIYSFSFNGSFIAYVNDFVVNNNSWNLSFEGNLFGAGM